MLSPEYTDGTYLAPIIDKGQEVLQMQRPLFIYFPTKKHKIENTISKTFKHIG